MDYLYGILIAVRITVKQLSILIYTAVRYPYKHGSAEGYMTEYRHRLICEFASFIAKHQGLSLTAHGKLQQRMLRRLA